VGAPRLHRAQAPVDRGRRFTFPPVRRADQRRKRGLRTELAAHHGQPARLRRRRHIVTLVSLATILGAHRFTRQPFAAAKIVRRTPASAIGGLYPLSRGGVAPAIAAFAAARAVSSFRGLPASAASAPAARHGTCATAPSTTRARVHVSPLRSIATATSTI